jgi:endoglucanase
MPFVSKARRATASVALAAGALLVTTATPAIADDVLDPGTDLYVNSKSTTLEAARHLKGQARADARLLGGYAGATWFTEGTPRTVEKDVDKLVRRADRADAVPVLVAYNIPFRDCAQYSAGGATSVAEYEAWIDAFAEGIGRRDAVVILEPDGLGIIPWYTTVEGTQEWCQPAEADAETAAAERFAMLNYAVDRLAALPSTAVYLDATHNGWLNVGDVTDRLLKAGVEDADGFFLNASNYQYTENLEHYGTWVSSCITLVTELGGAVGDCGNQYWSGGPANNWTGVALSPFGVWSDTAADPALNTAGVNSRYAQQLGGTEPTTHFVIDTSRNGQGPWAKPSADPQWLDWCNPPDRGLGYAPTTDTGHPLVDAYLWIKVPGESDGACYRGSSVPHADDTTVDPEAGKWFAEQARELIELADPPLVR